MAKTQNSCISFTWAVASEDGPSVSTASLGLLGKPWAPGRPSIAWRRRWRCLYWLCVWLHGLIRFVCIWSCLILLHFFGFIWIVLIKLSVCPYFLRWFPPLLSSQAGIASIYRLSGDYNPLHVDPGAPLPTGGSVCKRPLATVDPPTPTTGAFLEAS